MKLDKRDMIVAHQAETYVYAGDTGYICVVQKNYPDDDTVLLIDPQNAEAIADAIKACVSDAIKFRAEWMQEEGK